VPYAKELTISDQKFASYISSLKPAKVYNAPHTLAEELWQPDNAEKNKPTSRLIDALSQTSHANKSEGTLLAENKTLTENADIAFATRSNPRVDAFYELQKSANNIEELLNKSWALDTEATLKVIFNARSIHLGKADKEGAYKALGWLYQYHPQTLLVNLIWLARPVIEKKIKKEQGEKSKAEKGSVTEASKDTGNTEYDDFEMVNEPKEEALSDNKPSAETTLILTAADAPLGANTTKNDVKYGVAHGYWKDLANILMLAVNDEFKPDGNIARILNVDDRKSVKPQNRVWDQDKAKAARNEKQKERHSRFEAKFGKGDVTETGAAGEAVEYVEVEGTASVNPDRAFKALHLTVARLFASQLRADISALVSGKGREAISLAAKWFPSPAEAHDKQTFIVTSVAEALFPFEEVCTEGTDPADRLTYLKHARYALRSRILSPLRKHLAIVERDITAGTFASIKYERVPSLAMSRFAGLFLSKDEERFAGYLEKGSTGETRVSGAVLLPSTLIAKARQSCGVHRWVTYDSGKKKTISEIQKLAEQRLLDGQWKTLVKRIKDSGKIESAIAVCDVSGSMGGPRFPDGTCPMDSAIGLSLLLAEVATPPFDGTLITFSDTPAVHKAGGTGDSRSLEDKVGYIMNANWGMNTNFVAVFEDLILPIAVKHNLKQEEMVKQVFVFSDMQFDSAQRPTERWSSSHERIKKRYAEAGYEVPELVFWNLAAGTRGAPVDAGEEGVSLVSGYSQGMLKTFLEGGNFKDEVEEEVVDESVAEEEDDDGEEAVAVQVAKRVKKNPLATVKKAISHLAYAMLKVVD
jgi:hypothetical protein